MPAPDVSKYEVISRCLQAASGAVPVDKPDKLYFVEEEDNQLVESLKSGSEAVDQDLIAEDVKSGTPVSYLYEHDKQRYAFFVDQQDNLKFYQSKGSWEEAGFGSLSTPKVHPHGKLAATFTPDGIAVYYQDPSGNLKGLEDKKGKWTALSTVSTKTQDASPLALAYSDTDKSLYLYYVGTDSSLHYQSIGYEDGKSQDHVFPQSKFDQPIQSFMIFSGPEKDQGREAYFKTPSQKRPNASVFTRVDSDGTRATLGYLEKGKFEPDSTAQCFRQCYCPCVVPYTYQVTYTVTVTRTYGYRPYCYCY